MSNYERSKETGITVVSPTNRYFPLCEREPKVPIHRRRSMSLFEILDRMETERTLKEIIEKSLDNIEPIDTTKEEYRKNIPLAIKNIWASLGLYNMERDKNTY